MQGVAEPAEAKIHSVSHSLHPMARVTIDIFLLTAKSNTEYGPKTDIVEVLSELHESLRIIVPPV